ncbi:MAG TPA: AAA family ATPase [Candidatus Cloacimonadota bacterium]|nr:AAA family ATPase [Candidatus Cloacimonadota bacterium]
MTYTPGIGFGGVLDGDNEGIREPLLILIGGAPGTGKSSVASRLYRRLENSVWLDGDDLWMMNPFRVTEARKAMVLNNAAFVLSSYISESFSYIIFSWVMHEPAIVQRLLCKISLRQYRMLHYPLCCSEATLMRHISSTDRDPGLCLARLRSIRENYPDAMDIDAMSVEDVVQRILKDIQAS